MSANDLNTVDLRDGDKRVVLRRGAVIQAAPATAYAAGPRRAARRQRPPPAAPCPRRHGPG